MDIGNVTLRGRHTFVRTEVKNVLQLAYNKAVTDYEKAIMVGVPSGYYAGQKDTVWLLADILGIKLEPFTTGINELVPVED